MALIFADLVEETTDTTGTGSYTLAGAVTGFQSFASGIGTSNETFYAVTDGTDWEVSRGTLSDGTTLTRAEVLSSSNSGSAVNWGAGTKRIYAVAPADIFSQTPAADRLVWLEDVNGSPGLPAVDGSQLTGISAGAVGDLLSSYADPGAKWLETDGAVYLQSAWPELFAVLGLLLPSPIDPVKITDPSTLPAGTGTGASWSPDGRYLAIAHVTSPYVTIYDWDTGSPVKITDPSTLPTGTGRGASWSPDGRYLAIAHDSSPFVTIYDWDTGSPVKITDPSTLPTGAGTGASWSPDGRYLAIAHVTSPYVTIYDWDTGSPVKITDPSTLPAGTGTGASWSPDGRYLAIAHVTSPFVTIYDWNTGSPVKITDPSTLPTGTGRGASWSPDGRYLAIAHDTSPYVTIYDFDTGSPVKIANPAALPAGTGRGASWSPDGRYLAIAHSNSPFVTIYNNIDYDPDTEFITPSVSLARLPAVTYIKAEG